MHFIMKTCKLRLGLKLKKKNRILEFNQSQWLKPNIEFNTQKVKKSEKMQKKMEQRCTNKQYCIQENYGKLEKQNRCNTRKQRKGLFKMFIKAKLYVAENIRQ